MLLLLILSTFTIIFATDNVEVTAPSGKVFGSTLTTRLGKTIYAFRGIRYAEPPVNERRFKPPVPIMKWSGIYNATTDGPSCPQPFIRPVSEDCLFLNVYTTKLPKNGHNPKRAVIINLRHGGFYSDSASSNWAGPQYLLDQDIVLVTFNYRLGSLGFISVGKEAPGNNGLKDQVVVLQWVKKNIEAFGGDFNCITLYGCSAGSWSIHLHMVSPMSRGLFHKAIISSGSALGEWPLPRNQIEVAKKQARIVRCPDTNAETIMNCLKTKSAEELGNSLPQFREFGYDPVLIWSPVIEEDYGQERFLHENPIKLFKSGNFMHIPVVAGMTKDEFGPRALSLVSNVTLLSQLSNNFEKYAPICFIYERDTEKSREVSKAVRKFYLGEGPLTNASFQGLSELYNDAIETFPINRAVNLISQKSCQPVYYYQFTYQGRYSYFYLPGSDNVTYGVVHQDDLMYTFYISPLFPYFNQSYPESKMVEKLTTLWANFAKTRLTLQKSIKGIVRMIFGTLMHKANRLDIDISTLPEPIKFQLGIYRAIQFLNRIQNLMESSGRLTIMLVAYLYMDIGEKLVLKANMFEDRLQLWRNLYPLSLYN